MSLKITKIFLIFLLLRISTTSSNAQIIDINEERIPEQLRYNEETTLGPNEHEEFVPLSPVRKIREVPRTLEVDENEIDPATATLPNDVEVKNDSIDHIYYIMETMTSDSSALLKYWVNIDKLLEKPGVLGNKSHPILSQGYRRAVGSKISFKFPFYGHRMSNLTIATGGFIYVGDQTHNWLAATQFIAPLMANFHTQMNDSNIIYADDGNMFVVEWRNVQLREDTKNNTFSFQAILHKNGDIVFAYKDIPLQIENISDSNHPVKLGISDAYLFNHDGIMNNLGGSSASGSSQSSSSSSSSSTQPKRVIYEYHRIEVTFPKVKSNSVVILKAQPTCIQFDTCDSCTNATLKHFKCQWCHSKKKNGGPFCTDESGLHRRRQDWVQGNCNLKSKGLYCPAATSANSDDEENEEIYETAPNTPQKHVIPLKYGGLDRIPGTRLLANGTGENGASFATVSFLIGIVICIGGWLGYAYYNPHTTSGQLLIKYRPSRWHVPNSHVRYSASVHM
ncbi:unnamed protein product [Caenorhabditis angaria]|uniref:PSI domain-containing protein n=1 Tax=Caenorhabditis angaria TaxID=860376 RepID=A0A9P1MXT3_9PELO|nr:unnamed protein product [Caenorhabditis angaria]